MYIICTAVIVSLGILYYVQDAAHVDGLHQSEQPLRLETGNGGVVPGRTVQYFVEQGVASADKSPAQALQQNWQPYHGRTINLGNRGNSVWLRFSLLNTAEASLPVLLEIVWPFLRNISVWVAIGSGAYEAGERDGDKFVPVPEAQNHRHPLYGLTLDGKAETEVLVRLESSARLIIPLVVWEQQAFSVHETRLKVLFAGFFSAITVMLIYNSFLCLFTRDRSYLYYCIYVCSVLFYVVSFSGLGRQYLWPDNCWLQDHSYGVSSSFSFLTVVVFMRCFLSLPVIGGWLLQVSNGLAIGWGLILFAFLVSHAPFFFLLADITALLSCMAGLVTTIFLWWKGNVSAKYLTIAWTALILSTLLLMLGLTNITPYTPVSQHIQMAGFIFEVLLLSIALAERINRERIAKQKAQQRALDLMHEIRKTQDREMVAQRQVLELRESSNVELEKRVQQRTGELEKALLALEEANAELAELSITDPLTRIANRRYYEQVLDNEIQRAKRARNELSMLMLDIDHFKMVNDKYGHLAGDCCLVRMAETIKSQVTRPGDFVARFGGEEFVVILPETGLRQALLVAEKMRVACSKAHIEWDGQVIKITVSVGVSSTSADGHYDAKKLFEDADKALYMAKDAGRNRSMTVDSR